MIRIPTGRETFLLIELEIPFCSMPYRTNMTQVKLCHHHVKWYLNYLKNKA